jgi:hypothetical protein
MDTQQAFLHSEVSFSVKSVGETDRTLRVKNAPQGFINARREPQNNAELLAALYNDEVFAWISHEAGWYNILLRDGTKAWIQDTSVVEE